jgi:enoyl-CoA hydratase/carnithine racemase
MAACQMAEKVSEGSSLLAVTEAPGTQIWRMQAQPVNALNPELIQAIDTQLARAVADESVCVIVLSSALRIFSAGGDATWMGEVLAQRGPDALLEEFRRTMEYFREVCTRIRRSPLLIIAALNGHSLAGGLELASACDFRFAADHPKLQIGVPEMDVLGAVPNGGGGAVFLARILGPARALRFILDAKSVSPKEALAMGLVDQLFSPETLEAETLDYAQGVARKAGRVGVSAAKRIVLDGAEMALYEGLDYGSAIHWDGMGRGQFLSKAPGFVERFGSRK